MNHTSSHPRDTGNDVLHNAVLQALTCRPHIHRSCSGTCGGSTASLWRCCRRTHWSPPACASPAPTKWAPLCWTQFNIESEGACIAAGVPVPAPAPKQAALCLAMCKSLWAQWRVWSSHDNRRELGSGGCAPVNS